MFKFFKKLFENNEPEVMNHLYKLKGFDTFIRDNFKFVYDDYSSLVKIYLIDGEYLLEILDLEYDEYNEIDSYVYLPGSWDKHLIESINEIHNEWLNKDREKTIMTQLNRLNTLEHFERLFERKES